MGASDQLGVQCDRGVEDLGDRAVLLGVAGHSSKPGFVQVRHLAAQRQSRATDAESLPLGLESDRGLSIELCGRVAGGLQLKGQRHGEASGVSGGDQLFGICAFFVLEAGPEEIRRRREYTGIRGKIAAAVATRAAPYRFCLAYHVTSPCCCDFTFEASSASRWRSAHTRLPLESDLAYAGLSRGAPRIARWYSASNTGSSID